VTAPRKPEKLRGGFTLLETLIVLVVVGIVGGALARLTVTQSRSMHHLDATRGARGVASSAVNLLRSELSMVQAEGGVVFASPDSIQVRVPVTFGIVCRTSDTATTVSLLPADSATLVELVPTGLALRDGATYTYRDTVTVSAADVAACAEASVRTLEGGQVVDLTPPAPGAPGTPLFVYQTVSYDFRESKLLPLRQALWRTAGADGTSEELATPFDTVSAFRFFVLDADTSQAAPPASLSDLRGIELDLVGESERPAQGEEEPTEFHLRTVVRFKNRAN
jgi:prepilin-type N-terminal cleavage/methylation domain-containing protein